MKIHSLLLTGAALVGLSTAAMAETVTTKTYIDSQDLPNVNKVDFTVFDTNEDGFYSMAEVGERLFESFDRNNDKLLDNTEWDNKSVMTIIPMEKETFQYIDTDDDGLTEISSYTYETFYEESGLARFDENKNGLSAEDFVEQDIQALDKDEDNLIDMEEWKDAYLASRPEHEQPESYN